MESIYNVQSLRASENMKLAEYFENYSQICTPPSSSVLGSFLNLTGFEGLEHLPVNVDELEVICNPENLRLEGEPITLPCEMPEKLTTKSKLIEYYPINEEALRLNVIKTKQALEMRWEGQKYKFGGKRFLKQTIENIENNSSEQNLADSDFIFTIIIYKPFSIYRGQKNSPEKLRYFYEIEAAGSNLLSEIVDIIDCSSNFMSVTEVENTKADINSLRNAKEKYPAQTVFIDGVFYNDTRKSNTSDFANVYIEWAKSKNIGNFTTSEMQNLRLNSLTPRLGYPYVYIHQADCEHIFVFSDARLVQRRDREHRKTYPRIVSFNRTANILCLLCARRVAQWMVSKCNRFPQEQAFLCTECCDSYLYIDGEKVTDFQLYPCPTYED